MENLQNLKNIFYALSQAGDSEVVHKGPTLCTAYIGVHSASTPLPGQGKKSVGRDFASAGYMAWSVEAETSTFYVSTAYGDLTATEGAGAPGDISIRIERAPGDFEETGPHQPAESLRRIRSFIGMAA
jgi:hypothetical protein